MTIRWIPGQAIIAIHAELIEEHGGLRGTVNKQSLESTLAGPQQIFTYSESNADINSLAAAHGYGFARNHCFTDGNKRIALSAIDVFLQLNGFELIATEVDAVLTMLQVASDEMSEKKLREWINQNHQKVN